MKTNMKHIKLFEGFLNESKSPNFDFIESYAKDNEINYYVRTNRYTKFDEVVFYGSASEFFAQKDKKMFVQITEPTGFNKDSTGRLNIGIVLKMGKDPKSNNEISTHVLYDVNYKEGMDIY